MDEWVCFGSLNYTYVLEDEDTPCGTVALQGLSESWPFPYPQGYAPQAILYETKQ